MGGRFVRNYPLYPVKRLRDLKDLTDTACAAFAQHDAFRMMAGSSAFIGVSYERFGQELCALANALIDSGLKGQAIAVVGENSYPWVLTYLSVVNINATIVPLDKELTKEAMQELAARAGAGVLFYSNTYDEEAAYIKANIPGMITISFKEGSGADYALSEWLERGSQIVAQGGDQYTAIEIDSERTCTILFTSGTTGDSKGVMLSHRCLAANVVSACELILYTPQDTMLSVLPIHHTYEAMAGILCPINRGATIAFCEGIKSLPACLALFKPTVMVLVPLYVETFCRRIWDTANKHGKAGKLKFGISLCNALATIGIDLRGKLLAEVLGFFGGRLKFIISGGAALNPALVKSFKDFGVTLVQGYGATECSPIIAENRNRCHKAAAVGIVLSCNKVRIDDAGEILVKGENVMKGYLDDPKGTAEAFDGEWYKTGDLGCIDKDGFLYVTGRRKNLIVLKNGKNISPEEIEQPLSAISYVADVIVKEEPGNEYLMALIYPDQEALKTMGEEALKKAITEAIDYVNQKLVPYKRVRRFELRFSEFPKTTKRTIMRHQVKGGE